MQAKSIYENGVCLFVHCLFADVKLGLVVIITKQMLDNERDLVNC